MFIGWFWASTKRISDACSRDKGMKLFDVRGKSTKGVLFHLLRILFWGRTTDIKDVIG